MKKQTISELELKRETIASLSNEVYGGDLAKPTVVGTCFTDICSVQGWWDSCEVWSCPTEPHICGGGGGGTPTDTCNNNDQTVQMSCTPTCDTKPQHCPSLVTGCQGC